MKIHSVDIEESFIGSKGTHISNLKIEYEDGKPDVFGRIVKTFHATCGLTASGKFYVTCSTKDMDKVIPALKKHELFQKVRVSVAANALKELVRELGEDAVKLAFDEAIVKLVVET